MVHTATYIYVVVHILVEVQLQVRPGHGRACVHLLFRLCVAPGGQEHDPPDGVLGGGQAPAVGAVGRLRRRLGGHSQGGRRRPRGAVAAGARGARGGCPPELVTEGLLDLVSP